MGLRSAFIVLAGIFLLAVAAIIPGPAIAAGVYHSQAALLKTQTAAPTTAAARSITGNGATRGPHYNLNIHGVVKGGSSSIGSNGHDIFVPLQGQCKIALSPGDFQVLDPNCLDGSAGFQLPNPVGSTTSTSVTTIYSVWARALAKPGGSSSTTTCAYDLTGILICSTSQYVMVQTRKNGQSVFTTFTGDLLFVSQCIDTKLIRTPLFDSSLQDYFWQYDNTGLKLLQLRFYQVPTMVDATGASC